MTLSNNKDQSPTPSGNHRHIHHYHAQPNMMVNDTNSNHHHHSRLLYFLTDPSQAMLSLSRLPINYNTSQPLPLHQPQQQQHYSQQPLLFPTPTLISNTMPSTSKPKSTSSASTTKSKTTNAKPNTNNLATLLPMMPSPSQSIAVAAVDDCCNQCCPVIAAGNGSISNQATNKESAIPTGTSNNIGNNKRPVEQQERHQQLQNEPSAKRARIEEITEKVNRDKEQVEGETKCKWSSCVASFNTIEDLTPHLFKNHLNNSRRKQQQNNTCSWESCSDLIESGDLVNHLTSQHLKNTLLHACRWMNCSERFEAFDTLTIHLSQVHVGCGKSEYSCHWVACERQGKVFTQRQKIMRHIQTHTGAKPYQCSTCRKRFSESNIMTQHMRTHTGEKPFKCDQCGRQFSVSASLTIHKRVHSGEKPFACKYQDCNKRFAESSNLTKHMRVHTGERPFKCTVKPCGKAFSRPDQVTRHLKTHKDIC